MVLLYLLAGFAICTAAALPNIAEPSQMIDKEPDMPKLPNYFKTRIQWNINTTSGGRSRPFGMTVEVTEHFDGDNKRGRLVFRSEDANTAGSETSTLEQKVIYNPNENILLTIETRNNSVTCSAGSITSDDQLFPYFFWHNMSDPTTHPSVATILDFGPNYAYTYGGQETVNAIPCNVWNTTITEAKGQKNLEVTYWWSDPQKWTSSIGAGKSVPVKACVTGQAQIQDLHMDIAHYYYFFDFDYNERPLKELFQPPADLYCEGREGYTKPPKVPAFFSFKSEIIGYFPTAPPSGIGVVHNQQQYYDYEWQVSRLDYKPLDLLSLITGAETKTGTITEIHEFKQGLTYKIDNLLGNCTVTKIDAQNDEGSDIVMLPDGKVEMADPMSFLAMNQSFYYNGKFTERGIPADVYVARRKVGIKDIIFVWYISSEPFLFMEGQQIQHKQPMKLVMYHHGRYNDPFMRTEVNFYDFNGEEPNLQLYDISPCYDFSHRKHYIFSIPGQDNAVSKDMEDFRRSILSALSETALVSPLRISNIEIYAKSDKIYIIFTLLDVPPISGDAAIPELELSLHDASKNLQTAIDNGVMKIKVPVLSQFENITTIAYKTETADSSSLREVEREGRIIDDKTVTTSGYSEGSMAGLAVGMVFLGLLLASGIYVFILRGRVLQDGRNANGRLLTLMQ